MQIHSLRSVFSDLIRNVRAVHVWDYKLVREGVANCRRLLKLQPIRKRRGRVSSEPLDGMHDFGLSGPPTLLLLGRPWLDPCPELKETP